MAANTGQPPSLPYEPVGRLGHISAVVSGRQYTCHGHYGAATAKTHPRMVEIFQHSIPNWEQKPTSGQPAPGLLFAACTTIGIHIYVFGGGDDTASTFCNTIHRLDLKSLIWTEISTSNPREAPMAKYSAGMVSVRDNILVIVGGYGKLPDHQHPNRQYTPDADPELGWTNELHCFHVDSGIRLQQGNILFLILKVF